LDRERSAAAALARDAAAAIAGQTERLQRAGIQTPERQKALALYRSAVASVGNRNDFVLQTTDEKLMRTNLEEMIQAARLLEDAASIDATFPEPVAQLALVYHSAIPYDRRMAEKAASTARRAVRVDAGSAEGNFVDGYLKLFEAWDIAGAEIAFRKCIERSALYIEAYRHFADAATIRGRAAQALEVLANPLSVMPRSKILRFAAATTMLHARLGDQAEQLARESLRWAPDWPTGRWLLGRALEVRGRARDAEAVFREIHRADPKSQRFTAALAHVLVDAHGPAAYAEAKSLLFGIGMDKSAPALVGLVEARSGRLASALDWMERAEREHDHNLPYSVIDPHFEPLRGDSRGEELYRKFAA
jgi:tetratricopeptide (TPR) repeat protein